MGRKVFIPDDIELEIGELGTYYVPGDISTETVLKLQELSEEISKGNNQKFLDVKNIIVDLFELKNPKEKVEKINKILGFVGTVNILKALMEEVNSSVSSDTKNVQKGQESGE